jgi:hypothetical protein
MYIILGIKHRNGDGTTASNELSRVVALDDAQRRRQLFEL